MYILTGFNSHLIETFMFFTGVKQGKGCDYSVQRSWADHASESKITCSLTGAQDESLGKIILWLKHKTRRAELCSQWFCSTLGVWPRASHEFSVPVSSLVKMMTMNMSFSAELWVLINLHFQAFLILRWKYIAGVTALLLAHCIIDSKLTQVHQTNFSPTTLILPICSIRKQHSYKKPLFSQAKENLKGWLGAASLQACLAFTFLTCRSCSRLQRGY